jgi:signal transduction histidine kinase
MQREMVDREHMFRTAAWIWLAYLACLAVIDVFLYTSRQNFPEPVLRYHMLNSIPAFLFLGIAYLPISKSRLQRVAPLLILLITAVPLLLNHLFDQRLPLAPLANLEGMALRNLPVLLIGLVLVAWQYSLRATILYTIGLNALECVLIYGLHLYTQQGQFAPFFITLIRTICFIVVGIFFNYVLARLRQQQEALKLANAQLSHYASTMESLTISRERNHMSRELHDTVVHTLSGLSVQLETAKAYKEVKPETAWRLLDQSIETTRAGLQETRRALKSLRASPLEDLGLVQAIQTIVEEASQRGRLEVEVSLPEPALSLPPDIEQCLFRIAQEAIENVIHHADARHLCLRLSVQAQAIELLVQDDGIGFNVHDSQFPGHYGLAGMRERANLVCGELSVTSKQKLGTTVRLVIKG